MKVFNRFTTLTVASAVALSLASGAVFATGKRNHNNKCAGLPSPEDLQDFMRKAAAGHSDLSNVLGPDGSGVGGVFNGQRMWAAVVNRSGQLCWAVTSTENPQLVWPDSQAIAKAKAFAANGLTNEDSGEPGVADPANFPMSTARWYKLTQPGHFLYGLNISNPFDPECLSTPDKPNKRNGHVCGGQIFFGGGVPLHDAANTVIGGLGISGDTACADHEIAKRVRDLAGLNPPGGPLADDIIYPVGPAGTGANAASPFAHPTCANTVKNGVDFLDNQDVVPVTVP